MLRDERGNDVGDTLTQGQHLVKGGSLTSNNGAYTLTLQDDGNMVLATWGEAVWSRSTNGQDVVRAEVQADGNFVLYTSDKPVWATDTKGKKDVKLVLQDDRNLVLYAADGAAWSSKTDTDAPPPPAPEAAAPEVVPAAEEPAPAAEPATRPAATCTGACGTDLHRRLRGHPVGHRGAFLRRRQQTSADRRCERYRQSRPDPTGTGADDSIVAGHDTSPSGTRLTNACRCPARAANGVPPHIIARSAAFRTVMSGIERL